MHYKDPFVSMSSGAKVEPVLVEDINFYKAKFGKEPPRKKVKPSPAVTEKHYGIDNLTKLNIEKHKINLKRNIYLANQGSSLPQIYHILGNTTDNHPSVAATHEVPHTMEADGALVAPDFLWTGNCTVTLGKRLRSGYERRNTNI